MKTLKKKIIGNNQSTRDEIASDSCGEMSNKINELLDVIETKLVTNTEETLENRMLINSILDSINNTIERIERIDILISSKHKKTGFKQTQKMARLFNYSVLIGRIEMIREYHN